MKILVVSSYYQPAVVYGGPVQSIHRRNRELARLGHEIQVFTTAANGVRDFPKVNGQPVLVDGIPVTYFPRWWFGVDKKPPRSFFSLAMWRALRQLQAADFDLMSIHSNWEDPAWMAAGAARRTGTPYIYYTHGTFESWAINHKRWKKKLYFSAIKKRILQGAAGIIVCNHCELQELAAGGLKLPAAVSPGGLTWQH